MKKITVKIDGMSCGMCESYINDVIRRAFKVRKVTSSRARGETVILTENEITEEELRKALAPTGYTFVGYRSEAVEKGGQKNRIRAAYEKTGGDHDFYDGMITCSTIPGKIVCRLVWAMGKEESRKYIDLSLSAIPGDFQGKLLEIPVGTGVLTMPLYRELSSAEITCMDDSPDMIVRAEHRANAMQLSNVSFRQGDVGALPFENESFDIVLSQNGFHAFPDKEAAWKETYRVLKPGGTFCGCFYVKGEVSRTDRLINRFYVKKGYFSPPFETMESLNTRLNSLYAETKLGSVKSIAYFSCVKKR